MGKLVDKIITGRLGRLVLLLFGHAVFTPNGGRYVNVWLGEERVAGCNLAIVPLKHDTVGLGVWRVYYRDVNGIPIRQGEQFCTHWHFGRIRWKVIPPAQSADFNKYLKWIWHNA